MLPFLLVLSGLTSWVFASELKLSFDGLRNNHGKILYLVFSSNQGFPDNSKRSIMQGEIPVSEAHDGVTLVLDGGIYAMSLIHDENDNGKLDKNLIGLPKEGFGFSNNPTIFFGPPSFEKSEFKLEGAKNINLKVKYL